MNGRSRCKNDNLPCCTIKEECILPMMTPSPRCEYLLIHCLFYRVAIGGDFWLHECEEMADEMGEFLDYLYTGGENIKKKEPILGRVGKGR